MKTKEETAEAINQITRKNPAIRLSDIGRLLRDDYEIPSVRRLFGTRLTGLLEGARQERAELEACELRVSGLVEHLRRNPKDYDVKRTIPRLKAKIFNLRRRLNKPNSLAITKRTSSNERIGALGASDVWLNPDSSHDPEKAL